jgi:hypothetical protein
MTREGMTCACVLVLAIGSDDSYRQDHAKVGSGLQTLRGDPGV